MYIVFSGLLICQVMFPIILTLLELCCSQHGISTQDVRCPDALYFLKTEPRFSLIPRHITGVHITELIPGPKLLEARSPDTCTELLPLWFLTHPKETQVYRQSICAGLCPASDANWVYVGTRTTQCTVDCNSSALYNI